MKKLYLLLLAFVIIAAGAYFYVRFHFLKAKDFKPDNTKASSPIDLRPAIIAKLQQMVKDGSDGLYLLSLDTLNLHILANAVDVTKATLTPDSAMLKILDSRHQLPDDIFKISFASLHIDGVHLSDILSKNSFSLGKILIKSPVVKIFHQQKSYNNDKRKMNNTLTLYKKITKNIRHISIDTIKLSNGTFISDQVNKKHNQKTFHNVSIEVFNLLIDSSTQFDTKRFLFAKQVFFSTNNFSGRTPDSLYFYKCRSLNISAAEHKLVAKGIELFPRYNKPDFENRLPARQAMFNISIPSVTLSGVDWWGLTNLNKIIANDALVDKLSCKIFLDRSLPFRQIKPNNFPHQLLMRLSTPVFIKAMRMRSCNLEYNEYNPGLEKLATIYIDNMNGDVSNITNIPAHIHASRFMKVKSSGMFMHKILMKVDFGFDLLKYKTGNFTTDLHVGAIDKDILNPIASTSGEFFLKKGSIQKGVVHIDGNNTHGVGHGQVLYRNLYLVGLKKNESKPSGVKKKSVLSFIGNVLLIKNNNPQKGDSAKMLDFTFERKSTSTFLNVVWGTIFTGILKTIGLPPTFGNRKY